MSRSRRLHRMSSGSNSSSSSTSPERGEDDDNDSIMLQANDSQSSLGMDLSSDSSEDAAARRAHEERCRVSPVHRLPAELLIAIFSRLSSPADLQPCMLVSKEWARNSVGLLWHRPAMSKWNCIHSVVQSIRKPKKFFAYQDLVKRLNMSTLLNQVSDGTLAGMTDCKRIERLTLTNCVKLTDLSIQPLIDGNRSLLALDVTGLDQLTDRTMFTVADSCLRLQGLNVTSCKRLTDASISAVARSCRHLKRLKFNHCPQLTDNSIMTIAAYSTHLLEIDLFGLTNLESPAVTALLTSCPHLREMRLAHCSRINDSAFLSISQDLETPITFDSLRILDLTDCTELGDKGVEKIVQSCPRLRNLILAKCRQITDRAVFAITKLGKNLHYIHLGHCARITDHSVEALAKACNRIRYIDLACCTNLTDNSVTKLAGLPKLKRIGLVKCAGITDRSIRALAMGEMKGDRRVSGISVLERVHLSYCTALTLAGVHTLLAHCPKLTHLSLTGVQAFLREDLLAFCREAPPEFNDHQRDVFCVFSGPGVGRLREFLHHQQTRAAAAAIATAAGMVAGGPNGGIGGLGNAPMANGGGSGGSSAMGSEIGDGDGDDAMSEFTAGRHDNAHVINMNVASQHAPGSTPIVLTTSLAPSLYGPPPPLHGHPFANHALQDYSATLQALEQPSGASYWQTINSGNHSGASNLSQSAPASMGPLYFLPQTGQYHGTGTNAGTGLGLGLGGAQHVTGMMGAAVLDEVDEGDETFGEDGSETEVNGEDGL